ncbi:MAG: hypothetical protein AAF242_15535 [Bacteroidota bacterium]
MGDVELFSRYLDGEITLEELKRLRAQNKHQQAKQNQIPKKKVEPEPQYGPTELPSWINALYATTLTAKDNNYDKDNYSSGGYRETTKIYFYQDRSFYYSREFFMSLDTYSTFNDQAMFGPSVSSMKSSKSEDKGAWTVIQHENKPYLLLISTNDQQKYYYELHCPETGILYLNQTKYVWEKMS